METVMMVLETIGIVSFAISGSLVAIGANLDLFGVVFLGVITAVGGGIIRDIIIGNNPPLIFGNWVFIAIAVLVSILVFIVSYIHREKYAFFRARIELTNNLFDAMGLAVFTVRGIEVGFASGVSDNVLILVVIGMLTGVGGGIFRDVLSDTTPYVFKKHIYAVSSIVGSVVYIILRNYLDSVEIPSIIAIMVIFIIRMLSTKYRWKLPRINGDNQFSYKFTENEKTPV